MKKKETFFYKSMLDTNSQRLMPLFSGHWNNAQRLVIIIQIKK